MSHRAVLRALAALCIPACTIIVDPEVGEGLGTPCSYDDQCQGASCIDGICALRCGDSNGCPGGTVCADGACQLPMPVGLVYAYEPEQFDFVRAFDSAREDAEALGYVTTTIASPFPLPSEAADQARAMIALGNQVVIATSPSQAGPFAAVAAESPDATIFAYQAALGGENLVAFDARIYQAYYLAGLVAGRTTATNRVGIVASTVSPRVIASVNAFALGVQREAPSALVELRFLGEPHDTQPKVNGKSRERVFVEQMVQDDSCDVIAHTLDNNIPVATVRDLLLGDGAGPDVEPEVYVIGHDVEDACAQLVALPDPPTEEQLARLDGRCVATTFYQWGPLLSRLLDDVHRGRDIQSPVFENIKPSNTESVVGFAVDDGVPQATKSFLDGIRSELASEAGARQIFTGPIDSTGDCPSTPCIAAGATLDEAGLLGMCWLVAGIVGADSLPATVSDQGDCAAEE